MRLPEAEEAEHLARSIVPLNLDDEVPEHPKAADAILCAPRPIG